MSNKNKKSGIIFAAWTVGALIVLIAFLVNGNKIISNLKTTDFFERVFGQGTTPEFVKNHKDEKPKSNGLLEIEIEGEKQPAKTLDEIKENIPSSEETAKSQETQTQITPVTPQPSESYEQQNKDSNTKENKPSIEEITEESKTVSETQKPVINPPPAPKPINLHIYYVVIDSDGSITRKESLRSTTKRDAPLTAAIELLLAGPTVQERNSNYMTLIPSGTKLLNAYIKNGVAVLNFSEAFEYNTYGVEGYLGQLMQIVYTATSFSTVESVQFLIEGQKKDYLGSEGVWIGSPLARTSFK